MHPSPGTGYFVGPTEAPGPAVLLLHSFWGLNAGMKRLADELADLGFTTLAIDLADGEVFEDRDAALAALGRADMNVAASLVQSSARLIRSAQADPEAPIGVVGFGSGASWALWLSARLPSHVAATVTYYGSQSVAMTDATSAYWCHWADADPHVSDQAVAELGLSLQLAGRDFHFEHHAETESGFAETDHPNFDGPAAAVAWRQTVEFLARHLHKR